MTENIGFFEEFQPQDTFIGFFRNYTHSSDEFSF